MTMPPPQSSDHTPQARPEADGGPVTFGRFAAVGPSSGSLHTPALRLHLSLERLLWAILIVVAALTRLWDLGYRTQHHDESIHTVFAWKFSTAESLYVHNPLSHGPFLFHLNALVYQLFGGSDATSRLAPALAGVAIVWVPWLLRDRQQLGRWGALATSTFLLVSPTFLYYSRFIRHDPYTALGCLLLLAAIFRYFQTPHRKWIILAFASVAFLLANHEIVFAILLAFVAVLWGALVITRLRMLIPVHVAAVALMIAVLAMNSILDWRSLPAIPWQTGGTQAAQDYYGDLITHPLVLSMLVIGIAFVVASFWAIRSAAARSSSDADGPIERLLGDAPQGSVAKGIRDAWNDPISVGIGALLGLFIFFSLFTTLFTNLNGIATATYATDGTLLYWLGQHDVQRGEQPWFYFITEGIQYEWLVIAFGFAAILSLTATLARRLVKRDFRADPRLLFRVLVAVWMIFMLLVLSWAGEKMPWLLMHIVLPAAVLGGTAVEDVASSVRRWYRTAQSDGRQTATLLAAPIALAVVLVALAGAFFLIAANLTQGGFGIDLAAPVRSVPSDNLGDWWMLAVPLGLSVAAIVAVWLIRGRRSSAFGVVTGVLVIMLLFQIHAGFRMSFLEGDVAVDTLIYNTVAPDATMVVDDVVKTSELYLGDHSITVSNDGCTNWPLEWYFKDMPNHRFMASVSEDAADLPDIIVGVPSSFASACNMPDEIPGYTSQTYVFRWHEPEASVYRKFAIAPEIPVGRSALTSEAQSTDIAAVLGSIWSSFASIDNPDQQQKLWRLLMYRELPAAMSEYRFKVYIQNDVLPYYNEARYGQ